MPKFPEPPPIEVLIGRGPRLATIPTDTIIWRIYFRGSSHPATWSQFRRFGPLESARFDHHDPPPQEQRRGVLYAAMHGVTCIAEVFQSRRLIDRVDREPWLVGFHCSRPLHLLDITGSWITLAGASMAISSGNRARARRWSRAFYAAFPDIDGLLYPSSMHANEPCLLLYERAESTLHARPQFHRALSDAILTPTLGDAAHRLGYELLPLPR
jgi:hypothetical protein